MDFNHQGETVLNFVEVPILPLQCSIAIKKLLHVPRHEV